MEDNKQYEIPVSCRSMKKKSKKQNPSICKEGQKKKAKENRNLSMSCSRLIVNKYVLKSLVFV